MLEKEERINPMHKQSLQAMCKTNELPEAVFDEYLRVKSMADRANGALHIGDLINIALRCGFNPETMKFEETKTVLLTPQGLEIETVKFVKTEKTAITPVKEEIPLADPIGSVPAKNGYEKTIPAHTAVCFKDETKKEVVPAQEEVAPPKGEFSIGQTVEVVVEDEINTGKIAGIKDEKYTVDLDNGETVTVTVDDIEAI